MTFLIIAIQLVCPIVTVLVVMREHFHLRRTIMTAATDFADTVAQEAVALAEKTDILIQKVSELSAAVATLQAASGSSPELDAVVAKLREIEATTSATSAKEDAALTSPDAA